MSADVFESFLSAAAMRAVFAPASVVQALLDVEAALVRAQAAGGDVPAAAAQAIAGVCKAELFDVPGIVNAAARGGSLPGPVVAQLRATVALFDAAAAEHVHRGMADQDLADTAMNLLVRRAWSLVDEALARLIGRLPPCGDGQGEALAALSRCRQRLHEAGTRCLRVSVAAGRAVPGWAVRLAQGLQLGEPIAGALGDEAARLQAELGILCALLARLGRETSDAPPAVGAAALRAPQRVAALLAALSQGPVADHAASAEAAGLWLGAHGALVALADAAELAGEGSR